MDAATTSILVIGDEDSTCSKDNEHSNLTEEPTTACPNSQNPPLDAKLGGENIITTQSAKASKLRPRRRNTQKPKAVTERQMKKDKKVTDVTNDHVSLLSDSTCWTDVTRATEASSEILATEENTEGNKSVKLSESSCLVEVAHSQDFRPNTDNAVSVNLEKPHDSDWSSEMQHKKKETEAESENHSNSQRKRKNFSTAPAPALDQSKRRKTGERSRSKQRSRNDDRACRNQASEVEVGDDVTLAQFLQQIKEKGKN